MHKHRNPDLHIAQFSGKVFLMANNGEALAYATRLMIKHKGWVEVFIVEPLTLENIPKPVRRVAEWKAERPSANYPTKENTLKKLGLPSMEELKDLRLNILLGSNVNSSESLDIHDLMKKLRHVPQKTKKNSKI